jgi:alpha-1,2-rhamnosyltransferase
MVGKDCKDDTSFIHLKPKIGFLQYMFETCADVGISIPGHPYRQFYALWVKAFNQVEQVADDTWWYDEFIYDPNNWYREHITRKGLIDRELEVEIHTNSMALNLHSNIWYAEQEARAQSQIVYPRLISEKHDIKEKLHVDQIIRMKDVIHNLEIENSALKSKYYTGNRKTLSWLYKIRNKYFTVIHQIAAKKILPRIHDNSSEQRLLIDCTSIIFSKENTGIQRVERNILESCISECDKLGITCKAVFFRDHRSYKIVDNFNRIMKYDLIYLRLKTPWRFKRLLQACFPSDKFNNWINNNWKGNARFLIFFPAIVFVLPLSIFSVIYSTLTYHDDFNSFGERDIIFFPGSSWWTQSHIVKVISQLRGKNITTSVLIHDILPVIRSQFFEDSLVNTFSKNLRLIINNVDVILANSESTQASIKAYMQDQGFKASLRLAVMQLGVHLDLCKQDGLIRNQLVSLFNGKRNCYVAVGTIEPRKNYPYLLKAFEQLWSEGKDIHLIIIGKYGWKSDKLKSYVLAHSQYAHKLFWFSDISDAELAYCYKHANALVYPSMDEGFGLPLVESLIFGCPVIASDIPVFREVGQEFCKYFSIESENYLAIAIKEFENEESYYRTKIKNFGWPNWEESSRSLIDLLIYQDRP